MTNIGPARNTSSQIKCGHCKGYHTGQRGVFFCSQGPHAQANRAALAANARVAPQAPSDARNDGADPFATPTIRETGLVWKLNVPQAMVENLKEGRYAVRRDTDDPFVFVRVSRPTRGRRRGCLVIQTQHSDWYEDFVTIYPSGKVFTAKLTERLDMALFIVCADPMTAAINYGRELGHCSRCGRELTDERSRYYSIGPECEKHWPEIIAHINEESGEWYLGIK